MMAIDREAEIDTLLSIDSMRDRLKLAEEVCVIFGWTASRRGESPRDRLAYEAWSRWYEYLGVDRVSVKANPRIDAEIAHAEAES